MKRRAFIKNSAVGVVGLNTAPFSIINRRREDKLGVALVGLGQYATGQLAPALQQTEFCYLAGIVTGTDLKIPIWTEQYNIPDENIYNYYNFDEIVYNDAINIVYIVLPNAMHAEYAVRALRAGKHVICEKPMATNTVDANLMIETASKMNRKLAVGYRLHYDSLHLEMMRRGQQETHGKLREVEARFEYTFKDKRSWRHYKHMSGGGPLIDIGLYAMQSVIYTLGELPVSVSARNTTEDDRFFSDIEGSLEWEFGFLSKIKNKMAVSYEAPVKQDFIQAKVRGKDFGVDQAFSYTGRRGFTGERRWKIPLNNQQATQMDAFARNVIDGTDVIASGEMGARDIFLVEKIYESMETEKSVSLRWLPEVLHRV